MMTPCTSSLYTHALLVPVPQEYDTPHPLHSQHEPGKYKINTHFESQGTFSFCLNFRRDVNQTLQLHLHRWIRLFLTGFDPVWPKPACTYRTSILQHAASAWSKGNQGAREGYLCDRANRKFLFYYPKLFPPVPLRFTGKKSTLFPYKKFKENPVEKWMGHCFSCRSGEKFTGAADHLER